MYKSPLSFAIVGEGCDSTWMAAGANPAALLQRTGLTLDAGQVVFGFGGNYGDCAAYRGRLVAVPEAGGTPKDFTVDAAAGESQGAIWMGGAAPAVDSHGRLWVSVGNGSVHSSAHAYDDSDSALELSSSLRLLQFFAPSNWASNNSTDLDMSMAPALLPDGQEPRVDGEECVEAGWFTPAAALQAHRSGQILLVFPTIKHLEQLDAFSSADGLLAYARGREVQSIQPRVVVEGEVARVLLPGEPGYDDPQPGPAVR